MTQFFLNLPVADLERSKAFYLALGYTINPKFSDAHAACVVISDSLFVMLLTRPYFQGFTDRAICDTTSHIEALFALSSASREAVDGMLERALGAGGREVGEARDLGFMFQRSFADPDGHTFEVFYMNEAEFPGAG